MVDVRRFPGSRRTRRRQERSAARLPDAGIDYRWEERLGGRRRREKTADPDADGWGRVEAFRAYAAHTRTPEFLAALDDLVARRRGHATPPRHVQREPCGGAATAGSSPTTALLLRGADVAHLAHDGRTTAHEPSDGARVVDGLLRDDVPDEG